MTTPSAVPSVSADTRRTGGLLVVDPDPETRRLLREFLAAAGFPSEEAPDVQSGLAVASGTRPVAVVLHDHVPGEQGLEILQHLRAQHPDLPVVFIAHFGGPANQRAATRLDGIAYVDKPFRVPELIAVVRRAVAPAALPSSRRVPRRARRPAAPAPAVPAMPVGESLRSA